MAVVLPDRQLRARKRAHPSADDAFGTPVPGVLGSWSGYYPGAAQEQTERGSWSLRVDVRLWELNPGDEVSDGALTWVVESALKRGVPGVPDVDFIQVVASLSPPEVV